MAYSSSARHTALVVAAVVVIAAVADAACVNPTGIDDATPGAYVSANLTLPPNDPNPANSLFFNAIK
jgi:hypothetical protein